MASLPKADMPKEVDEDVELQGGACAKLKRPMKRSWIYFKTQRVGVWLMPCLAVLLTAVLFCVVGPIFSAFRNDSAAYSSSKKGIAVFVGADGRRSDNCPISADLDSEEDLVFVIIQTQQLQGPLQTLKVTVDYNVYGTLVNDANPAAPVSLKDDHALVIQYGKNKQTFTDGQVLSKFEATELLASTSDFKSYAFYPFDKYLATPLVQAYLEVTLPGGNTTVAPVNLCIWVLNTLSTFDLHSKNITKFQYSAGVYSASEDLDSSPGKQTFAMPEVVFERTRGSRFFSVFIVILMWALSSCMLVLAIDHIFLRPREPMPPTIGFSIALLFALPAVRNSQPDVPPIGAAVDVLGFFWNMSIAALSACMFMAAFMGYQKHKPMAP